MDEAVPTATPLRLYGLSERKRHARGDGKRCHQADEDGDDVPHGARGIHVHRQRGDARHDETEALDAQNLRERTADAAAHHRADKRRLVGYLNGEERRLGDTHERGKRAGDARRTHSRILHAQRCPKGRAALGQVMAERDGQQIVVAHLGDVGDLDGRSGLVHAEEHDQRHEEPKQEAGDGAKRGEEPHDAVRKADAAPSADRRQQHEIERNHDHERKRGHDHKLEKVGHEAIDGMVHKREPRHAEDGRKDRARVAELRHSDAKEREGHLPRLYRSGKRRIEQGAGDAYRQKLVYAELSRRGDRKQER